MTREEANRLIQGFAKAQGGEVSGLNLQNFAALSVGESDLYFQFHQSFLPSQEPSLEVNALIYRFRKEPDPKILQGFKDEAKAGTPAGGGELEYEEENKGLYLTRLFALVPEQDAFNEALLELGKASRVWGHEVLERVAEKVNK